MKKISQLYIIILFIIINAILIYFNLGFNIKHIDIRNIPNKTSASINTIYPYDSCHRVHLTFSESPYCPSGSANIGSYSFTVNVDSTSSSSHSVNYTHANSFCPSGSGGSCTQNSIISTLTRTTPFSFTMSRSPTTGSNCGTYQDDVWIHSVDGNGSCNWGSQSNPGGAGYCSTGRACGYTNYGTCAGLSSSQSMCTNAPCGVSPANNFPYTIYSNCSTCACHYNCCGLTPGSISGNLFVDSNVNGYKDYNESNYYGSSQTVSANGNSTSTNYDGTYTINNLTPGYYTVSTSVPGNYSSTSSNPVYNVYVNSGSTTYINFGIVEYNNISGTVYFDSDNDGSLNNGESGFKGSSVQVKATGQTNGFVYTVNTNTSDGSYAFSNLPGDIYNVQITVPGGYNSTSSNPIYNVDIRYGDSGNKNFGIIAYNKISGNIYNDNNGDKKYDSSPAPADTLYTKGSATITFSGPTNTSVTTSSGTYDTGLTLLPGTYTVSYSPPSGYFMSYPTPPSFSVTVGLGSCIASGNDSSCDGNGNVINLNFGITNASSWIQSSCGDWRQDSGITNSVPSTGSCGGVSNSNAIVLGSACTTPGIFFSGDSSSDFSPGSDSTKQWIVGGIQYKEVYTPVNPKVIRTSYTYMTTTLKQSGITPTDLGTICSDLNNCTLPTTHGVYQTNSTVKTSTAAYTLPAGQNILILVGGDLYINGGITIPNGNGGSIIFSVKGNINITSNVGQATATDTTGTIAGFYSTDKSFIIQTAGTCADKRFNLEGSVVVNAGYQSPPATFQNQRNLCSVNLSCPTISIVQRPDLLLTLPNILKHKNFLWQEIAPGAQLAPTVTTTPSPTSSVTPTNTPTSTPTPTPTSTPSPTPGASCSGIAGNLVSDCSFETVVGYPSPWSYHFQGDGAGSTQQDGTFGNYTDGLYSAKLLITSGSVDYYDQFDQSGIPITAGHTYKITFDAKSSAARNINVVSQQNASPYAVVFESAVSLTTNWQTFTYSFTASTGYPDTFLGFNVGTNLSTVWIDNVSMIDTSTSTPTNTPTPTPTNTPTPTPSYVCANNNNCSYVTSCSPNGQTCYCLNGLDGLEKRYTCNAGFWIYQSEVAPNSCTGHCSGT